MIEIDQTQLGEPVNFDERCRKRGRAWLLLNPKANRNPKNPRPKDYWSPFRFRLADGFKDLCAYGAMYEPVGTVDHFIPVDADENLSYEWTNYRFCSGWINSSKKKSQQILDPLFVRSDWFEVLLPSLQLVVSRGSIPAQYATAAEETLERLHLRDDERILRQRRQWYTQYQTGKLTLEGLYDVAPLIAVAVEKQQALAQPQPAP